MKKQHPKKKRNNEIPRSFQKPIPAPTRGKKGLFFLEKKKKEKARPGTPQKGKHQRGTLNPLKRKKGGKEKTLDLPLLLIQKIEKEEGTCSP